MPHSLVLNWRSDNGNTADSKSEDGGSTPSAFAIFEGIMSRLQVRGRKEPRINTTEIERALARASASDTSLRSDLGLLAIPNYYNEYTYTAGDLTKVETYATSAKTAKLYTKDLTYTLGVLTSIVTTDESTSGTTTQTLSYDGSGNLTSIDIT